VDGTPRRSLSRSAAISHRLRSRTVTAGRIEAPPRNRESRSPAPGFRSRRSKRRFGYSTTGWGRDRPRLGYSTTGSGRNRPRFGSQPPAGAATGPHGADPRRRSHGK
jgi:hypothetical protein